MRHARDQDLDRLEPLLEALRALPGLTEKKRGTFYRKSRAFLHFHENAGSLYADIRDENGADFERLDVTGEAERAGLLQTTRARLESGLPRAGGGKPRL